LIYDIFSSLTFITVLGMCVSLSVFYDRNVTWILEVSMVMLSSCYDNCLLAM